VRSEEWIASGCSWGAGTDGGRCHGRVWCVKGIDPYGRLRGVAVDGGQLRGWDPGDVGVLIDPPCHADYGTLCWRVEGVDRDGMGCAVLFIHIAVRW
jgi:hypothetical protein